MLILNVVNAEPAGTCIELGTVAALAELDRDTKKLLGATPVKSTSLPATVLPPVTEPAFKTSQESVTGFKVRTALATVPE